MQMFPLLIVAASMAVGVGCQPVDAHGAVPKDQSTSTKQAPKRVDAFLQALNEGTPEVIKKMVEENFDQDAPNSIPLPDRVQRLTNIAKNEGPFTFVEVLDETDEHILISVKARAGREIGFLFLVDRTKGGRFKGIRMGPPEELIGAGSPPPRIEGWTSLDDLADKIIEREKVPGLAIAVIKDGKLEQTTRGTREIGKTDPPTTEDRWTVGSIGKSFTGTLAAMVVDKGLLKWDSTVGEVLKDVPMKDGYKGVTLLQLLQHRAGVPQDQGFMMPEVQRIVGGATTPADIRKNYVKDILSRDMIAKPGTTMSYSNAGYALAAAMIERATGKSFEEAMADHVFKPLNLKSALYAPPGSPGAPGSEGQPKGHRRTPNGPLAARGPSGGPLGQMFVGAGGMLSMSISDLARYAEYHLKGLRGEVTLMSKANFDQMHKAPEGPGERYGTGWSESTTLIPGVTVHHHNGGEGTFHADMGVFPAENLVVVAVGNFGGENNPASFIAMANGYWGRARK